MTTFNFKPGSLLPMSPEKGPPLPEAFGVYWPWYKEVVTAPPVIIPPAFDPWSYDTDGDNSISQWEFLEAANDFIMGKITTEQRDQVAELYLSGTVQPPPLPTPAPPEIPPEVPAPPLGFEFSDLLFDGKVRPSLIPVRNISAQFTFTTPDEMTVSEAYIFLGKLYERGTEPQPIACPVDPPWPFGCTPADMGYRNFGEDYVFLPLPVLLNYQWSPEAGWEPYRYGGTRNPWFYSSGHPIFPMTISFSLTTGANSMVFPRSERPGIIFLQPVLAGEIYGDIDVFLLIGDYFAVFPQALTVLKTSNVQKSIADWVEAFRQPYLEPPDIPQLP